MERVLFGDPIYYIIDYLNSSDLYNLGGVSTFHRLISKRYINEKIISNVENRLKTLFRENYFEFLRVLERSGGVISGSFILQCFTGDTWDSDIDIYVPVSKRNPISERDISLYTDLEVWLYEKYHCLGTRNTDATYTGEINNYFITVRDYSIDIADKAQIQVITVDDSRGSAIELINRYFDMDICKNIYTRVDGKAYINIKCPFSIIHKKTVIRPGKFLDNTYNRYKKYKNRGFDIIVDIDRFTSYTDGVYLIIGVKFVNSNVISTSSDTLGILKNLLYDYCICTYYNSLIFPSDMNLCTTSCAFNKLFPSLKHAHFDFSRNGQRLILYNKH